MSRSVEQVADALWQARVEAKPIQPIRNWLVDNSIESAYSVQRHNLDRSLHEGRRLVGWKIGLTAEVVQEQLGVDQPDFGPLFADMSVGDDVAIPLSTLIRPRVEAEVAFLLGADLDVAPVTTIDVVRSTQAVLLAIEVVDSRVEDWDITILDTIADDASSARFVLGTRPRALADLTVASLAMEVRAGGEVVSSGSSAQCLGNPVNAVVWLANTLNELGTPIRAGQLVLSGALGPMHSVTSPGRFEAHVSELGSVTARFV